MKKKPPAAPRTSPKDRTEAEVLAWYARAEAEMKRPMTEAEKAELEEDFKLMGLRPDQPQGGG